jgi:hypothetical protein
VALSVAAAAALFALAAKRGGCRCGARVKAAAAVEMSTDTDDIDLLLPVKWSFKRPGGGGGGTPLLADSERDRASVPVSTGGSTPMLGTTREWATDIEPSFTLGSEPTVGDAGAIQFPAAALDDHVADGDSFVLGAGALG